MKQLPVTNPLKTIHSPYADHNPSLEDVDAKNKEKKIHSHGEMSQSEKDSQLSLAEKGFETSSSFVTPPAIHKLIAGNKQKL